VQSLKNLFLPKCIYTYIQAANSQDDNQNKRENESYCEQRTEAVRNTAGAQDAPCHSGSSCHKRFSNKARRPAIHAITCHHIACQMMLIPTILRHLSAVPSLPECFWHHQRSFWCYPWYVLIGPSLRAGPNRTTFRLLDSSRLGP
jgi:hypothetical protein